MYFNVCDTVIYFKIEIYKNLYNEVSSYSGFHLLSLFSQSHRQGNQEY